MVRQRLVIATLLFLGAFAVIAQLAWNTAESTGGPWFSTSISRDLYSTTLISATILVAILAALAAGLSGLVGRETRALDLRLNILRSSGVVTAVAGPMAAGLLFLGISGAMLPGAEGFAESHYILNTALVLFLGYGWPILVGWTAVGLWFARVQEGRPATAAKAAA